MSGTSTRCFFFLFFPQRNTFPTHGCTSLWKGNSRTSAADGKDTTNPKHLLYSSPNLIFKCVTFMFLIRLVPRLCLASLTRLFMRNVIGRHKEKGLFRLNSRSSLETYSEIYSYFYKEILVAAKIFLTLLKYIFKLQMCINWSFPHPLLVWAVQVEVRIKAAQPREFVKVCIYVRNKSSIWRETNERWCKSSVNIPEGTAWSCSRAETSWITISIQKFLSACYECALLKIRPCVWSSLPILLNFVHRDIFVIQRDKTDHDSKQWSI